MFGLVLALVLMQSGQVAPAPVAPVAAAPVEDPAVTALALKIYSQMRAGKVDSALLSDQMNKAFTPEVLAQTQPMFDQLGNPTKLTLEKREAIAPGISYTYLATFPTAQLHVIIFVDDKGKVGGYRLAA